jgi:peptidoglycan/LPS O-acetylase OafA/YrhL
MTITSPAFYFVLIGLLIGIATLLSRGTRQDAKKLNVPLESLRGLLAVSVLSCHALVSYFSFKTGKWDPPPSAFYSYAGTESVEMFFFMSAFLFWSKCLANNGVGGYGSFLVKRLRRLAPAYYVSALLILLVVLVRTHFRILISPLMFLGQLLMWLVFIPTPTMNGLKDVPNINASVTWTLFLEILFYLMLPVLYRIFKGYRILIGVGAALAIYATLALRGVRMSSDPHTTSPVALGVLFLDLLFGFGFGLGLLLAFVFKTCPPEWLAVLRQRRWTPIALLCLAAPMLLKVKYYDAPQFLFVIVFFAFVAAGNDFFGFLSLRGVFLLGTVSYSFYLTHGIVLYVLSHGLNRWVPIVSLSPLQYWGLIGVVGIATTCLATLLYRNVEVRFMHQRSALAHAVTKEETAQEAAVVAQQSAATSI